MALCAALVAPDLATLAGGLLLGTGLIALAMIDVRLRRLPDPLTLGLVVAGLLWAGLWRPAALPGRLVGAAAGYACLAAAAWAYRRLRGRHGLGLGDAKLLAAAGAWLGWRGLPAVLLVASIAGLAAALLGARRAGRLDPAAPLAFGPALALATWLGWAAQTLSGPDGPAPG